MGKPIKIDDLGVPLFLETPKCFSPVRNVGCAKIWVGKTSKNSRNAVINGPYPGDIRGCPGQEVRIKG